MNHKSVCVFFLWQKQQTEEKHEPADRKSNVPLSRLPRKIREGEEEGESDEVTGECRRKEMKGS